jgi:hypothetical protein
MASAVAASAFALMSFKMAKKTESDEHYVKV